jgi:hypothetical protein
MAGKGVGYIIPADHNKLFCRSQNALEVFYLPWELHAWSIWHGRPIGQDNSLVAGQILI